MRVALVAIALLLAACGASEMPPEKSGLRIMSGAEAQAEAARAWAEVADTPVATGAWRANADATLAEFVSDAPYPGFTFGCTRDFLQLERLYPQPHGFDWRTGIPLTILTPRETIALIATVGGERDSVRLWLALPSRDFRLDDMVDNEGGFAIQAAGEVTRFSHDPLLARVLANCRRD